MARNKSSPALFEVVHGKKHFDKSARTGVLRTPSWWFKGRKRMADTGALAHPEAGVPDEPPSFEDVEASPNDPTQQPRLPAVQDPDPAPAAEEPDPTAGALDVASVPAALTAPSSRRRSPFQFVLDRDRHELYVRVRYTTAIVAGFALLVLVALAYVTGRNLGRGPSSAMASASADEIAAGPVEKGVLDVAQRPAPAAGAAAGNSGAARPPAPRVNSASVAPPATSPQARTTVPPAEVPAPAPDNGKRIIGRQYVIIQSYPDKKDALAARDFLLKNGVACTVENLQGWQNWSSVVGTTAFDRASGPAFDNYMASLERLSQSFAGKSTFRRFEPMAIRWKDHAG